MSTPTESVVKEIRDGWLWERRVRANGVAIEKRLRPGTHLDLLPDEDEDEDEHPCYGGY